jgi:hypothetical protein
MLEFLNKIKGYIIVVILNVIITFGMIKLLVPKPQPIPDYRPSIDSLKNANTALQQHQAQLDVNIEEYKHQIDSVDHDIDSIANKIKNVGDKYNKISQKVSNVKNLQLDSFLLNKLK